MLHRLWTDTVIGIKKHNIRGFESTSFARSPGTPLDARRHGFAIKQRSSRPDRCPFKRGDAAFRQGRKPRMQFFIRRPPGRFFAPFEMPTIWAAVGSWRVLPCDAKNPVCGGKGTQKGEFNNVADITGVLIAHTVSNSVVAQYSRDCTISRDQDKGWTVNRHSGMTPSIVVATMC